MTELAFSCACGHVKGRLDVPSRRAGNHVVCHCPDCRAAEIHLGQPDPAPNGVEIWQTTPDRVTIDAGADQLALIQLSPKGLFRWHARCCGAPLFNTLRSRRLPFVGIPAKRLSDTAPLGPITTRAFMAKPGGGYEHDGFSRAGIKISSMMLGALVSGRWRDTPFFNAAGHPVVAPHVLTRDERRTAYGG
ncbi:DUF6151 family protein [Marimonas arenosa]|uniref:DUF6151 family protein n=1 Tax=Marimonas arenosa TaxID=1795305 RepID=A0AAE3WA42_9RHOB|nr:DUF6151 family protein [Marimonas arenosa]MDQ2089231.1 DUF6151 family protein [Marimonas arenosa]